MTTYSQRAPFYNAISSCLADGSDSHTVLVPRSLSNPHGTPLAFSSNPGLLGMPPNGSRIRRGEALQGGAACAAHFTFCVHRAFGSGISSAVHDGLLRRFR